MYQAGKTVSKSLNQGVVYATTVKVGALLNVMRPYTLKTTRGLNYSCKMKTCEWNLKKKIKEKCKPDQVNCLWR